MRGGWSAVVISVWCVTRPLWAGEVTLGERTLRVPEGYEVELVAAPPLVERPISIARDERGRLYVTDSAGMSDKADKQLAEKPHRIRRLEDRDGDGRYDHSTLFADRVMFPEGCLWFEGSLYVAAPPEIWKFTDADDDGHAEHRSVWYDGKTLTGCANDLHGPYLGHDGWFYFCKGAFAEQRHTLPNGKPFVTRASHIFRCRPDGSQLEPVLTGGMDNPVGVAFLSTGERILSCTFFQYPAAGRRDGLIHAIYGGVYGKKHDSIYEHKQTGDVMPVLVHQGPAAPCGVIAGSESLFGGAARDHIFACYFNLHQLLEHTLISHGATFRTSEREFLGCDHPDFHPTDVLEDADGSLLIVDTGGWYKVCCPTSQIARPDVLGAIYRVRKQGQPRVADPLGTELAWDQVTPEELATRLADSRLFVHRRATQALRQQGPNAVAALETLVKTHVDSDVRRRAVWTLALIAGERSSTVVQEALNDADPTVRLAAIHVAGLRRDSTALEPLRELLRRDPPPAECRAAAEALGRLGRSEAAPELFAALARLGEFTPDDSGAPLDDAQRILEHSLIYALIEWDDPDVVRRRLKSPLLSVNEHRAALVALDQMDQGGLQSSDVLPLLDSPSPLLRQTAAWIAGHHPEWGTELAAYFAQRLAEPSLAPADRVHLTGLLARLAKSPTIQAWMAAQLVQEAPQPVQQLILQAMTDAGLTATPPAWFEALVAVLSSHVEGELLTSAVAAARQWPQPKSGHAALKAALIRVGQRDQLPPAIRLEALLAAGPLPQVEASLFAMLLTALAESQPMSERNAAATVLGSASLTADQQMALAEAVADMGPLELPKILPAFERAPSEPLGLRLVAALKESAGLRGLRADLLQPLLQKYPPSVQQAGEELLRVLNTSAAEQAAYLDRLLEGSATGDARRGHELFIGKKAQCINCHTLGYLGGRLGPDLTNIGKVRTERDLLEAIVFPSASFVRGYEPVVVELEDGRTLTGIITRESRQEVVLAVDPQKTQHIARQDIAEIHPAQVSLMPQGIDKLLTPQELMDLVVFLKTGPR